MRRVGYGLITLGFLAGAFVAVRQVEGVAAEGLLACLALGVVGVALVRRADRAEARDEVRLTTNIQVLGDALERLVASAERLSAERDAINVYDLRHRIDDWFFDDLAAFVDARESIAHSYGLQAYADVMNRFAAGERYLNRVWSASTDGYVDEAHQFIERATEQLEETLQAFRRVSERPPRA
jgi:hypothetical protein